MSEVNFELNSARAGCTQFDVDLPAYLEGEDRPGIARHASECGFCAAVLGDLELIRSQSHDFLFDDPPARVWANVRATLVAEGFFRTPKVGWLKRLPSWGQIDWVRQAVPLGATACLALIAAALMVSPGSINQNRISQSYSEEAAVSAAGLPLNESMDVDPSLAQSVSAMEKSYREHEKFLDPAVQASYRKGLQSLDDSIRQCRDSVRKEPTDTVAREYLTSAYEQKASVLFAALEYDGR